MYYECMQCGQLDRIGHLNPDESYRPCPNCGERTRWTLAFEGGDGGVSF